MTKVYKLFCKDKALIICPLGTKLTNADLKESLEARFPDKKKHLIPYIQKIEKSNRYKNIILYSTKPKKSFSMLKSCFDVIDAGGGFVFNPEGELIGIYKNKLWDLPKGKRDKGENNKECAEREVKEETGIKKMKVHKKIGKTYHIFNGKNGRSIKKTHWYRMTAPDQKLYPQKEENIDKVAWRDWFELKKTFKNKYRNLYEFMGEHEENLLSMTLS